MVLVIWATLGITICLKVYPSSNAIILIHFRESTERLHSRKIPGSYCKSAKSEIRYRYSQKYYFERWIMEICDYKMASVTNTFLIMTMA